MGHSDYLDAKVRDLRATDAEVAAVGRALVQAQGIMDRRDVPLSVAERYPAGSFAKGTMLRDRKEADYALVLNHFPPGNPLEVLRSFAQNLLPGVQATPRWKALELTFPDGVAVDVLPVATRDHTSNFESVPERFRVGVNGRAHASWFLEAAHGTVIHPTVILLKGIRNAHSAWQGLSSFGLELLAVNLLPRGRGRLEPALRSVLSALADRPGLLLSLTDPADPTNRPLVRLTESQLLGVQRSARELLSSLDRGQPSSLFVAGIPATAHNLGGRPLG